MCSRLNPVRGALPYAAIFALAVAACGTETSTTSEWSAQVPASGPIRSIVVVGAGVDAANRRILEDELSAALARDGVSAKPSYQLLPSEAVNRQQVQAAVQGSGYQAVLVSRMRGVQDTTEVQPGYGNGLWDGYYGGWDGAYVTTDVNVKFENTLWDASGNGKLLWVGTTSTLNPTSDRDFATSLSKAVVPDLMKAGFIPKAK